MKHLALSGFVLITLSLLSLAIRLAIEVSRSDGWAAIGIWAANMIVIAVFIVFLLAVFVAWKWPRWGNWLLLVIVLVIAVASLVIFFEADFIVARICAVTGIIGCLLSAFRFYPQIAIIFTRSGSR